MREHQIVITLKPDQFLEVQRLARAANAKSMGIFVRQQLLAALGIEGTLQSEAGTTSNVDVQALLADLKRVHGDLKGFVAESLSPYSPEAFGQTEPTPEIAVTVSAVSEDACEDSSELVLQTVAMLHAEQLEPMPDELERIADKAFAISPRLGSVGDPQPVPESAGTTASAATAVDSPREASRSALLPAEVESSNGNGSNTHSSGGSNGNGNGKAHELLSRHEMHYRRDMHRYNHPHAASEFMDVPFSDAPQPTISQPAPQSLPFVAPSESPGSSSVADPLSKLLSGEEMNSRPIKPRLQLDEPDDDAFDVPLSIAERTRALGEEVAAGPIPLLEPPHPALQPTSPADLQYNPDMPVETTAYDAPQSEPEPIQPEENAADAILPPQAPETAGNSASPAPPADPNPLGRPLGYPPLSGSPPPKRRQL